MDDWGVPLRKPPQDVSGSAMMLCMGSRGVTLKILEGESIILASFFFQSPTPLILHGKHWWMMVNDGECRCVAERTLVQLRALTWTSHAVGVLGWYFINSARYFRKLPVMVWAISFCENPSWQAYSLAFLQLDIESKSRDLQFSYILLGFTSPILQDIGSARA